jgi:hypothetical protein
MATVNFTKPVTSDLRADVLSYIRDAINSQARMFNGDTLVSAPVNTIRWDSSVGRFQYWTGSAWGQLGINQIQSSGGMLTLINSEIRSAADGNSWTALRTALTGGGAIGGMYTGDALVALYSYNKDVPSAPLAYMQLWPTISKIEIGTNAGGHAVEVYGSGAVDLSHSWRTDTAFQMSTIAGGAAWNVHIAPWHGYRVDIPTGTLGGWARGMQALRASDSTWLAGVGFYGTDQAVDGIVIGYNAWYAPSNANPGLIVYPAGQVGIYGSSAELRLYDRAGATHYMSWYSPNPGRMHLYNAYNSANRWEFDDGTVHQRHQDSLTYWLCPADNLSFGLHVNSNLAYFMRSDAAGTATWTTNPDLYGTGRYPMILNLATSELVLGGLLTVHHHVNLSGTLQAFKPVGLTDYTNGAIEIRTSSGDAGIGFHNAGANACSLIYSRSTGRFGIRGNPISGWCGVDMSGDIAVSGTPYTYGGVNFKGDKNGYGGPTFSSAGGTYLFTLMCHTDRSYLGIYDEARGTWPLYTSAFTSTTKTWNFEGGIVATQNITAYSDARLKKNVVTLADSLSKVRTMRGVSYDRTDTPTSGIGVIAQEMELVEPAVVSRTDDGTLTVAYANLVGHFIEAIKELADRLEKLEAICAR